MFREELLKVGTTLLLPSNWAHSNNISHVFEFLRDVDSVDEIIHHGNLFLEGALFLELGDSTKCISHDSDQDVHENKQHEIRTQNKENPSN